MEGDEDAMSARAKSPAPRERSEPAFGSQAGPERSEWVRPDPISPEEADVEASLRPKKLTEFVGQPKVREQLQVVLESALRRNRPPDHVLLSGLPGLGKTSLAMIIAAELGAPMRVTSGPAIERAGDLAA